MPTALTTPVTLSAPNATLDEIQISIVRNVNLSANLADSGLSALFRLRRADGSVLETRSLSRAGDALPAAVRTAAANLHTAILAAARAAGVLPAGTDTPDL